MQLVFTQVRDACWRLERLGPVSALLDLYSCLCFSTVDQSMGPVRWHQITVLVAGLFACRWVKERMAMQIKGIRPIDPRVYTSSGRDPT